MIKIKKYGTKKQIVYKWDDVVCEYCDCIFSCDSEDTAGIRNINYISSTVRTITCPCCKIATIELDIMDAEKIEIVEELRGDGHDQC